MKNLLLFYLLIVSSFLHAQPLPKGFVYVSTYIPNIQTDLRYLGAYNFVGKPINGYVKNKAILTTEATKALLKVEKELNKNNLGLLILDAYRPQRAVNHFKNWAKAVNDTLTKQKYYPAIDKRNLFRDGYIASKSGHSRGSTIDLTIIDLTTKKELDMGTVFDFLGKESSHHYTALTKQQLENRRLLKAVMQKHGFKPYTKEWWHYTLINEPFKQTYFDFLVE